MVKEGYVVEEEGNVVVVDCGIIPRSSKYLANDRFESVKSRMHSPEFFVGEPEYLGKLPVQGKKTPGKPKILENSPP